jgi:YidC/Oxa1 family membrane protein insertase
MIALFHTLFYNPLYNGLVFLISILPHKDVGIAVILFTVLVKLVLYPLTKSSIITQGKMRLLEPQMKEIREKYKNNREELARKTMEFYRENKIKPFSSMFLILIQFPIILGLYFVFLNGGLPNINTSILYSFVKPPEGVNMEFLGLINIALPSIFLGLLAAISQYFQARLSIPIPPKKEGGGKNTFSEDLAHSMSIQTRYILPAIIFIASFKFSGAVALYWLTGNIFTIGQELYLRKRNFK